MGEHHPAYATAAGVWPVVFGALAPLRPLRSLRPLPLFLSLFPRVPLFFVSFVLSPFLPCCYFPCYSCLPYSIAVTELQM